MASTGAVPRRDFLYISKSKLDRFGVDGGGRDGDRVTGKAAVNVGVFNAEIGGERTGATPSEWAVRVDRAERFVSQLHGEISTDWADPAAKWFQYAGDCRTGTFAGDFMRRPVVWWVIRDGDEVLVLLGGAEHLSNGFAVDGTNYAPHTTPSSAQGARIVLSFLVDDPDFEAAVFNLGDPIAETDHPNPAELLKWWMHEMASNSRSVTIGCELVAQAVDFKMPGGEHVRIGAPLYVATENLAMLQSLRGQAADSSGDDDASDAATAGAVPVERPRVDGGV